VSKEDTISIQDRLANFVSKYKTLLLVSFIALVAGALGFGIVSAVITSGLEAEDKYVYEIEEWQSEVLQEIFLLAEGEREEPIERFIQGTTERLTQINSSVNRQLAMNSTATSLFQLEDYSHAAEWYQKAYESNTNSLIGLYSLKGEADSLTQLDQTQDALARYETLQDKMPEDFPMQDEILMTLGALYEDIGDLPKAVEIYNTLVNDFAGSNWTKLARSRILVLE
jgi:tetratricopeptide (TPR) repeat protein